ncbi:MAG TPA: hypothetical protein V6C86_10035 [Oculatellaceae cyanobacterium]
MATNAAFAGVEPPVITLRAVPTQELLNERPCPDPAWSVVQM